MCHFKPSIRTAGPNDLSPLQLSLPAQLALHRTLPALPRPSFLGMESPPPSGPTLCATIHIGASAVSMLLSQADDKDGGSLKEIEFLEKPLPLARDIFQRGRISRTTTEHAVEILEGFRETLREVGADLPQVQRAVVTNILSEAENHETFLNRVSMACSLDLEILDDGEMTRLIYLKTRRRLLDTPSMGKRNTLVVHVGPGNTRALLFRKGNIQRYSSYRLGSHRTAEAVEGSDAQGSGLFRVIREHIAGAITQLYHDYQDDDIQDLVVIGYEFQLLAPFLSKTGGNRRSLKTLQDFVAELADMTNEERVQHFQLDYRSAEAVVPALLTNLAVAELFELKYLRSPDSDYERGFLGDLPRASAFTEGFHEEVLRSARILGGRYGVDPRHAEQVAHLCGRLFEQTLELHNLDEHDSMILEVAALLHECGGYIGPRSHHKHSFYIIQNSEIFGLSRLDVTMISLVARYHRGAGPRLRHQAYAALSGKERMRVAKMSAILRVADALEKAHLQRVTDFHVDILPGKMRLTLNGVNDAAVERLAMQSKGDLFHDIFGLEVVLAEHF